MLEIRPVDFSLLLPIFFIMRGRVLFQQMSRHVSWKVVVLYGILPIVAGAVMYLFSSASALGTSSAHLYKLEMGIGKKGPSMIAFWLTSPRPPCSRTPAGTGLARHLPVEFPFYTNFLGDRIKGYWYFAHEDYLETWIEWGWLGCVVWGLLVFGGLARGLARFPERRNFFNSEDRLLSFAACLSLTGILIHALVDFPLQIWSLSFYVLTLVAILWNAQPAPINDLSNRLSLLLG